MANEIIHSTLQTNGGQVASVLSALLREQLYDPTDLRAVCPFVPFPGMQGSDAVDITKDAVPGAAAAATNETTGGVSNSAYTTSRYTLTVARYVRQYEIGDLLGVSGGPINLDRVVANLVAGVSLTYTDLIAALFPSLSNSVGTTGVNLDVDDIYDAMFQLNTSLVPLGPGIACVLHQQQMNDFTSSLRSEAGAMQFQSATAEMLAAKGPGYVGRWNGVDFWQADSVNAVNTSADRNGAMFGVGCFEWTYGPVAGIMPHLNPGDILFQTPELFVERNRNQTDGLSEAILNLYPAVAEREDSRGVGIITDL